MEQKTYSGNDKIADQESELNKLQNEVDKNWGRDEKRMLPAADPKVISFEEYREQIFERGGLDLAEYFDVIVEPDDATGKVDYELMEEVYWAYIKWLRKKAVKKPEPFNTAENVQYVAVRDFADWDNPEKWLAGPDPVRQKVRDKIDLLEGDIHIMAIGINAEK